MIDGQELYQLIRQLRVELEWASRTGIEVVPPKAEPVDIEEVLRAPVQKPRPQRSHDGPPPHQDEDRGRARAPSREPPRRHPNAPPDERRGPPDRGPSAGGPNRGPDHRPNPTPPDRGPPGPSDRAPPPRRGPAPKNRPWEAYGAPAVDPAEAKANQDKLTNASSLAVVRDVLGDCKRCKLSRGRKNIVFGVGNENADLMFVGEGPGAEEDRRGEPFVGKAGQLLTKIIEAGMGIKRDDVYIANIVKCRPPQNRDPEADEVEACEQFLAAQISVVKPKVIVALGRYASQTLLRDKTPITRMRGRWSEYRGIPVMPTYHPAYLLRNPAEKRPVWEDVQEVMARLGLKEDA